MSQVQIGQGAARRSPEVPCPRPRPQLGAAKGRAPQACCRDAHCRVGRIPLTLDSPLGGYYDSAVQRRKLRPREGTWPWSPRDRKGWGQRGCRVHSGHCRGLAPAVLSWAFTHPSLTSSFYKHRPSQAQREGDERGGGCGLGVNSSCAGMEECRPSPGVGAPLMLLCYRPAQPPPGLLSPVWSERSPCSLYRPVHTCLSPPSYPPAMGLSVSRPGAYPEVLGRYCELLLGVGAAGAASDTSLQPLAHQGCEGLCPSCLFHQDPCSWRGGDSKLLCVSQNPAPRPSLPCHLGPSSSVIGGFWGAPTQDTMSCISPAALQTEGHTVKPLPTLLLFP